MQERLMLPASGFEFSILKTVPNGNPQIRVGLCGQRWFMRHSIWSQLAKFKNQSTFLLIFIRLKAEATIMYVNQTALTSSPENF